MADSESAHTWFRAFPYRSGTVGVTRTVAGWQVSLGADEVAARSLVEAFEMLISRNVGAAELRVVLAAMASDREFGQSASRG
jgi:hypothetical protein